jgi:Zn-dependent metalloprotease
MHARRPRRLFASAKPEIAGASSVVPDVKRGMFMASSVALALLAAPLVQAATDVDENMVVALRAASPALVVERSPLSGRVIAFSTLSIPTAGATAEARARGFLSAYPSLARGADARLSFAGTSEAYGLVVARFTETYEGIPVEGSELIVTLDGSAHVTRVHTSVQGVTSVVPATVSDEDAAKLAVSRSIGVTLEQAPPYRVVIATRPDGTHVRAVRVVVARPNSFDARAVLVDTASGEIHSSQPATVR